MTDNRELFRLLKENKSAPIPEKQIGSVAMKREDRLLVEMDDGLTGRVALHVRQGARVRQFVCDIRRRRKQTVDIGGAEDFRSGPMTIVLHHFENGEFLPAAAEYRLTVPPADAAEKSPRFMTKAQLSEQLALAREENKKLRDEMDAAKAEIKKAAALTAVSEKQKSLKALETEMASLRAEEEKANEEIRQLREKAEKTKAQRDGLLDKTAQDEIDLETVRTNAQDLERQKAGLDRDVERLNRELAELRQRKKDLQEAARREGELRQQKSGKESQAQGLLDQIRELDEKIAKAGEGVRSREEQLREAEALRDAQDALDAAQRALERDAEGFMAALLGAAERLEGAKETEAAMRQRLVKAGKWRLSASQTLRLKAASDRLEELNGQLEALEGTVSQLYRDIEDA